MQPLVRLMQSASAELHQTAAAALEVLTMDDGRRAALLAAPPRLALQPQPDHALRLLQAAVDGDALTVPQLG